MMENNPWKEEETIFLFENFFFHRIKEIPFFTLLLIKTCITFKVMNY